MVDSRNNLISEQYQLSKKSGDISIIFFLGLRNDIGINKIYPDTIRAIASYTDDGIFFSKIACDDLKKHGLHLAKKYAKKHKTKPPKLNELFFDKAEEMGLLPPNENYEDWLQGFQEQNEIKPKSKKLVLRWPVTFTEKPETNQ